jgi:hypothetical protein
MSRPDIDPAGRRPPSAAQSRSAHDRTMLRQLRQTTLHLSSWSVSQPQTSHAGRVEGGGESAGAGR